jgi:regulator of protease activity HflC (stomatin/prohibitin superfamily)
MGATDALVKQVCVENSSAPHDDAGPESRHAGPLLQFTLKVVVPALAIGMVSRSARVRVQDLGVFSTREDFSWPRHPRRRRSRTDTSKLGGFAMMAILIVIAVLLLILCVTAGLSVRVVQQYESGVVFRLGKVQDPPREPGLARLIPGVDRMTKVNRQVMTLSVPAQDCITKDNVMVHVDGILYYKIIDAERATYGISNLKFAIEQLAQTTLRSEIGKIELDHTFEERAHINANIVEEIDKASEAWGVKVLRYEIKTIRPPTDILEAMEKQMRAEREKRAVVLTSEGQRDAVINAAEGDKQQTIKASEATRQRNINEAEGQAQAILAVATATAEGIRRVAESIKLDGGHEAVQLRVAEQYVTQFGKLAAIDIPDGVTLAAHTPEWTAAAAKYEHLFWLMMWIGVGFGVAAFVFSPLLRRGMHGVK